MRRPQCLEEAARRRAAEATRAAAGKAAARASCVVAAACLFDMEELREIGKLCELGSFDEVLSRVKALENECAEGEEGRVYLGLVETYSQLRSGKVVEAHAALHSLLERFNKSKISRDSKVEFSFSAEYQYCFLYFLSYILYKKCRFGSSLKTLTSCHSGLGGQESPLKVLQAQILYRLGSYAQSERLYAELYRDSDPQDVDLAANLQAARANRVLLPIPTQTITTYLNSYTNKRCDRNGSSDSLLDSASVDLCRDYKSFEYTFNSSCLALNRQNFDLAESLLNLCEDQLTKEASEEDYLRVTLQKTVLALKMEDTTKASVFIKTLEKKKTEFSIAPLLIFKTAKMKLEQMQSQNDPKHKGKVKAPKGETSKKDQIPGGQIIEGQSVESQDIAVPPVMVQKIPMWYIRDDREKLIETLLHEELPTPNYLAFDIKSTTWRFSPNALDELTKNSVHWFINNDKFEACARFLGTFATASVPSGDLPSSVVSLKADFEVRRGNIEKAVKVLLAKAVSSQSPIFFSKALMTARLSQPRRFSKSKRSRSPKRDSPIKEATPMKEVSPTQGQSKSQQGGRELRKKFSLSVSQLRRRVLSSLSPSCFLDLPLKSAELFISTAFDLDRKGNFGAAKTFVLRCADYTRQCSFEEGVRSPSRLRNALLLVEALAVLGCENEAEALLDFLANISTDPSARLRTEVAKKRLQINAKRKCQSQQTADRTPDPQTGRMLEAVVASLDSTPAEPLSVEALLEWQPSLHGVKDVKFLKGVAEALPSKFARGILGKVNDARAEARGDPSSKLSKKVRKRSPKQRTSPTRDRASDQAGQPKKGTGRGGRGHKARVFRGAQGASVLDAAITVKTASTAHVDLKKVGGGKGRHQRR